MSAEQAPIGVVLAGGRSRRMGRDKAVLRLDGETLLERAARRLERALAAAFGEERAEVVIAGGDRRHPGSRDRARVRDGPGGGPAAGILGAAAARPGHDLVVVACDLPRLPAALLSRLAAAGAGDLLVPRHAGGIEPLCARWGQAALRALAARVAAGEMALHAVAADPGLDVRYLEGEALSGDPAEIFLNLNTPADLDRLRA